MGSAPAVLVAAAGRGRPDTSDFPRILVKLSGLVEAAAH
jgi:hypothetical protein